MKRLSSVAALAAAGILIVGASPALAAKPSPFCPTAFTAGSVEELADILTGFATIDQVRSSDHNANIPGVGYQVLDDGGPR